MREAELLQDILIAGIPKKPTCKIVKKVYLCQWLLLGAKLSIENSYMEARSGVMCCILKNMSIFISHFFLQMAGKWYMVGLATNAQWFVNHKADMKMGTAMLAPTAGEDLDLSYATLK